MRTIISYWVVPCAEDGAAFQSVIEALARAQNGAVFQPHISLGSLMARDPDIGDVTTCLKGLTLTPSELGRSDVFTQSLFVNFEPDDKLQRARACPESRATFRSSRAFEPHISLCYGAPVNEAAFAPSIEALLKKPVRFDCVQVVEIGLPVETYDQVRAWSPLATHEL